MRGKNSKKEANIKSEEAEEKYVHDDVNPVAPKNHTCQVHFPNGMESYFPSVVLGSDFLSQAKPSMPATCAHMIEPGRLLELKLSLIILEIKY